jgi:predicted transcriptional regulator
MSRPSPQIATKSINLACFLSMHHSLLVKVEVNKTGKRSDQMRLTFTHPFVRKMKKDYKPDICYVTEKNLLKLTERISCLLDEKKRANYQQGLVTKSLVTGGVI